MIPEAVFAMLACARIGAIHSVVFGGFSAESLRDRINGLDWMSQDTKVQAVAKLNATGQRSGDLLPYAAESIRRATPRAALLSTLANQAALAIETALLHDEMTRQAEFRRDLELLRS